jgi:hypothetical protein
VIDMRPAQLHAALRVARLFAAPLTMTLWASLLALGADGRGFNILMLLGVAAALVESISQSIKRRNGASS